MSFWSLSDGKEVETSTKYEEASGGWLIPDNTKVLAYIDETMWSERDSCRYVSNRWRVAKPESLKNRVVFQKLWVLGNNPQKKDEEAKKKQGDKARKMIGAIDANAGGELRKLPEYKDEDLQRCLMNKMMVIVVRIWSMTGDDGNKIEGNWVSCVEEKGNAISEDAKPIQVTSGNSGSNNSMSALDDDIPFACEWRI